MASRSEFARVAAACLEIRMQLPQRLWPTFALVEEAALKHSVVSERVFMCDPDESCGMADVHDIREKL